MILVADIQRAVAEHYGVPVEIMREPCPTSDTQRNPWPIARKRQVAMCLAERLTGHSYTRIGQLFGGRDPTTVRHACKRAAEHSGDVLRQITLELARPTWA